MAENKNENVVIAFFQNEDAAQAAIDTLKSWDEADDDVKLGAIGTIVKQGDNLRTHVPHKIGKGVTVGAAVGIIAGVLTGGIGLLGGVVAGGALGGVTGAFLKQNTNLDKKEIDRIGQQLDAGNAAVVVACDDYEVGATREQLESVGGEVWEYAVTKDAIKAAQNTIARIHNVSSSIEMTPDEARETAAEAYVFAFPMMEMYRTMLAQAVIEGSPAYVAPFNVLTNNTELLDASYTTVVRPNDDTLYSTAWLDLRDEPMVISVPAVTDDRYYELQLVDLYTHNFGYIGPRATGSGAGNYLVVGPYWQGKKPDSIDHVFHSECNFVCIIGRTAVDGPDDVPAAVAQMEEYTLTQFSKFRDQPSFAPSEPLNFPVWSEQQAHSAGFINYFNFLLGQVNIDPKDDDNVVSFGGIGVGRNRPFDVDSLKPEMRKVIEEGVEAGHQQIVNKMEMLGDLRNGWILTGKIFGNRKRMQDRYLTRAAAAMYGLGGNDIEEAYYPSATEDSDGEVLDASKHNYTLTFTPDEIPAVDAFWSLTLYSLPDQLFVDNDINRYSIGDRTPDLQYADDGSLTIYIQSGAPEPEKRANWLPANAGPFSLQMRMYLPKPEALEGPYGPPPIVKA